MTHTALQAAVQDDDLHSLHEKLAQFEKRASVLREKEKRFSTMLAEKDSLKDSLHQQKIQSLLLEQANKELQARVCLLEEEVRRGESRARESELEGQEVMRTLDQYRTKITKLNNTVRERCTLLCQLLYKMHQSLVKVVRVC